MKFLFSLFAVLFIFSSAQAALPKHILKCIIERSTGEVQNLHFSIDDVDVKSGHSTVKLSIGLEVPAQASISWNTFRNRPAIKGLSLELGALGMIQISTLEDWDQHFSARASLSSSVSGFPSATSDETVLCTYSLYTGTRPGFTGSN